MASHGIVPTLMYGLAASAPGLKDIQRMQHQLTRHVRAITHLFAHLSIKYPHRTQDLCRRFKLPTVLDLLNQAWQIQPWTQLPDMAPSQTAVEAPFLCQRCTPPAVC